MDYEITEIPKTILRGKWLSILRPLPFDKAVKFSVPDKKAADRLQATIYQTCRNNRHLGFKTITRRTSENNSLFVYVWKIAPGEDK